MASRLFIRSMLSVVVVALLAPGASAKLVIDYFDFKEWETKREVRIFVDMLDSEGNVVPADKIPTDEIKVSVEGEPVQGTVKSLTTVKEAGEPIAIAILVSAHTSYAYNNADIGEPNVMEAQIEGYKRFLDELSDTDYVGLWFFNSDTMSPIRAFQQSPSTAKGLLESRVKASEKKEGAAPGLYFHLKKLFEEIKENEATLGGVKRRIVVVMTDGFNKQGTASRIEQRIAEIAELANETNTKLFVLGYSLSTPEWLPYLDQLAQKTGGTFRQLSVEEINEKDQIAGEIAKVAQELKKQYVVTFHTEDYGGAERPVRVRLEAKIDGAVQDHQRESVEWPKIPFDFMVIVKWVGIVLGSLLGIFLIIFGIKALGRRKGNRPVAVAEEEEFVGPYKGKLTCQAGAYAGAEFFLTEEVTTIGAIDGNTIVLQEAGVSKRHAGIKIEEMRFELADFGSTNGTYVNGSKITKQFLRDGDLIRIGEAELKFSLK